MTNEDFAPAPWELQEFGIYPGEGPTKYRIVDSEGVTIGFTYGYSRQDWLNGSVMKAAPDLLAACEGALGGFEYLKEEGIGWSGIDILRAAIAKARGEQP